METFTRIPEAPPPIPALTGQAAQERPLWSVMVPAYNCGEYLSQTLRSVLAQDPGEALMQIEVVDDASTDIDVGALVHELGGGRVSFYRQPFNRGSLRNFETCLLRSRGHLVHLLHGDDTVKQGFYEKMGALLERHPQAGAAFCRYVSRDHDTGEVLTSEEEAPEAGILEDWLPRLACKQRIQTPAMVVRREVYESLGAFYAVHYGEDWEMWLRIAAHYPTAYHPDVMAEYRKHAASISGRYILTGQNIRDLKTVMNISKSYFSASQWTPIHKQARVFYAHYAINTARKIWGKIHDREGTICQIREAMKLHQDPEVWIQSLKLFIKMALGIRK